VIVITKILSTAAAAAALKDYTNIIGAKQLDIDMRTGIAYKFTFH
jgi:hypothetical protein